MTDTVEHQICKEKIVNRTAYKLSWGYGLGPPSAAGVTYYLELCPSITIDRLA